MTKPRFTIVNLLIAMTGVGVCIALMTAALSLGDEIWAIASAGLLVAGPLVGVCCCVPMFVNRVTPRAIGTTIAISLMIFLGFVALTICLAYFGVMW